MGELAIRRVNDPHNTIPMQILSHKAVSRESPANHYMNLWESPIGNFPIPFCTWKIVVLLARNQTSSELRVHN